VSAQNFESREFEYEHLSKGTRFKKAINSDSDKIWHKGNENATNWEDVSGSYSGSHSESVSGRYGSSNSGNGSISYSSSN